MKGLQPRPWNKQISAPDAGQPSSQEWWQVADLKHLKTSDIFSLPRNKVQRIVLILKVRLTDRLESTTALSILDGPESLFVASRLIAAGSMNFLKMQIIQDKSKPTRVAMIWLRLKVNRTRLCTAAHFARPARSILSPYYFQAPALQATHEVCCNHCFPHTRSLGFVARGRNSWPSPKRRFFQHWPRVV